MIIVIIICMHLSPNMRYHCVLILQNNLTQYLLRYVQNIYNQNATVTAKCVNISEILFELQFTGFLLFFFLLMLYGTNAEGL